jgi:7-cyano-7-deazaguanine synthase
VSGGLDSCILLKHLLDVGNGVKPFYIRSGLCWEEAELAALERYLADMAARRLQPLTVFDLPLADVYGDHWSVTGRCVPGASTPDEAVFLPGRNVLLMTKAALWCQMHDIDQLALATLKSNPFEDASSSFFDKLGEVLSGMWPRTIRIVRPFGELEKQQVMEMGREPSGQLLGAAAIGIEHPLPIITNHLFRQSQIRHQWLPSQHSNCAK